MNALVTGVTGFTGGNLARALCARGHHVRGLVRPASLARASGLSDAGVDISEGDLADPDSLAKACRGRDVVYHVAATYREAGQGTARYRAVNVGGTQSLLEAALAAGVRRFVHCSTAGVHGHVVRPPANEDAPLAPGDVYQRTKLEAEQLAAAFGRARPLEVVIVRPIGIYGPGDTRFLKMFRGLARGRFPMLGRGRVFYHLTYIDDLVDGFRLCGEHPAAAGRTYILGGAAYTTLAELVALVAHEVGAGRHACTCRSGRSGSPARSARACACRSGSSRRSTGGAWTSIARVARSTSHGRVRSWGTIRASACRRESGGRRIGTAPRACCDR